MRRSTEDNPANRGDDLLSASVRESLTIHNEGFHDEPAHAVGDEQKRTLADAGVEQLLSEVPGPEINDQARLPHRGNSRWIADGPYSELRQVLA